MNQLVALMIASLSCANPPLPFRDFFARYYLPGPNSSHWSYQRGETVDATVGRLADAQADYSEYRAERADKCLRGRAALSRVTKGDRQ